MATDISDNSLVRAVQIDLEISIDAPVSRVWQALVEQTGQWWHKDFYTSPNSRNFIIEPKLGGRMYEDYGEGTGLIWMTVHGLELNKWLYLVGHISPPFGGPAISLLNIKLEVKNSDHTTFKLSDSLFGQISAKMHKSLEDGWRLLFEDCLKGFVES